MHSTGSGNGTPQSCRTIPLDPEQNPSKAGGVAALCPTDREGEASVRVTFGVAVFGAWRVC